MREKLVQAQDTLKNLTVHEFDMSDTINNDMSSYMDPSHYSAEISREIPLAIREQENILSSPGFDSYADTSIKNINNCKSDIEKMIRQ